MEWGRREEGVRERSRGNGGGEMRREKEHVQERGRTRGKGKEMG